MSGKRKPSRVSQVIKQGHNKYHRSGNGHRCPKSPAGSHWWVICSPSGAVSEGVCRYCGERREFANTLEASLSLGRK